jgi:hypothetical protein
MPKQFFVIHFRTYRLVSLYNEDRERIWGLTLPICSIKTASMLQVCCDEENDLSSLAKRKKCLGKGVYKKVKYPTWTFDFFVQPSLSYKKFRSLGSTGKVA